MSISSGDKTEISIDAIRELIKDLQLKAPAGKGRVARIIFIENAHTMGHEAQNSLLKVLEEPSPDTIFILSSVSSKKILPTIASRTSQIEVMPVSFDQPKSYFKQSPESEVKAAWPLSQGYAGLLSALLTEAQHPLKAAIADAKEFIKMDRYQRLLELDRISKDKQSLQIFIEALSRLLAALNQATISKASSGQASRVLQSRRMLQDFQTKLDANTNTKALVVQIAMNLPL